MKREPKLISSGRRTHNITISPTPCSTKMAVHRPVLLTHGRGHRGATRGVNYRELNSETFGRAVASIDRNSPQRRLLGRTERDVMHLQGAHGVLKLKL